MPTTTKDTISPCPSCGSVASAITPTITLRDIFAGIALNGLSPAEYDKWANLVTDAYNIADAMIAERGKAK